MRLLAYVLPFLIAAVTLVRCDEADDMSVYVPPSLDRVNGTAPDIILDQGKVIWLHVDGVGAITYLLSESVGTISLTCAFDQGQHSFDFRLERTHSIADHASNSTGRATIAFNDDPNKYADVGEYIFSSTVGVDLSIHCGCPGRSCEPPA